MNTRTGTITTPPGGPPRAARRWRSALMIGLSLWVGVAGTSSIAQDGPDIDNTRAELEKWIETRRIISQERKDWAIGREILQERSAIVQREIDALRAKITQAQENVTEADKKRQEMISENDTLKAAGATLGEIVLKLEDRTRALLPRLPEPIRDRIKPLSQRLPADPKETKLSLSERFQNVVGVLNEVTKFHREITMTSEVRTLPDGSAVEVTALYVGLSQGYYVSGNGQHAGVGTGGPDGWTWTPDNAAAPQIARAIAILKNEQVASFVELPIEIK